MSNYIDDSTTGSKFFAGMVILVFVLLLVFWIFITIMIDVFGLELVNYYTAFNYGMEKIELLK